MSARSGISVFLLCAFFVISLGIALFLNRNFLVLAVAGESSVGTWLSGVLLSCCAATALVTATHRGWYPWGALSAFFFFLAADEQFMFHERMKEWIVFSYSRPSVFIRELPVIIGALIGAWVSWILWSHLKGLSRALLLGAVLLGFASVVLDVTGSAALWEESFKLIAELAVACSLLIEASAISNKMHK